MYDPAKQDTTYTAEYVYLLREGTQPTRGEHDSHICGLFAREEWFQLLRIIGLDPQIIHDAYDRDVFLARKRRVCIGNATEQTREHSSF
jgi:hypothetical protein